MKKLRAFAAVLAAGVALSACQPAKTPAAGGAKGGLSIAPLNYAFRELPNGLFVWAGHGHGTYMGEMIGIAGLVNEFLLQSVDNTIRVFPCWPKEKDASFTNLRAQGGFLVTAEQKAGKITKLEITSIAGGKLRLLNPWTDKVVEYETKPGQSLRINP